MAEWDLRPTLNPETGLPHSFMEMPLDVHLELWSSAAAKLLRQSAYAALLVSMHGSALYEMRDLDRMDAADAEKVRRFLADRRAEQELLAGRLGAGRDRLGCNQRLVWTWDFMSLALCLDWAPATAEGVPLGGGVVDVRLEPVADGVVSLDPWPLAGDELVVRCEARELHGPFGTEAELHAALDAAPLVPVRWRLVRGR
jgi:hypothetical protein